MKSVVAPGRRMLRPLSLRAAFSSATPRLIVLRATPVATATAVTPPRPSEIASLAANNRRPRSSKNGDILSNRLRRLSTSITTTRYCCGLPHPNDISILSLRSLAHFDSIISPRFLDGVWATPPYLHNGSVPNIYALLSPVSERPKSFYLGRREFDPFCVGYQLR